jgi:hypothetical protein
MTRQLLWCAPVVVGLGVCAGVSADKFLGAAEAAKQDVKPAVNLPITRVVLFNSGHFPPSPSTSTVSRRSQASSRRCVANALKLC